MEAAGAPARTVEMEAEKVANYIYQLPRLLTEQLTINVTGGQANGGLSIKQFYGSGSLTINGGSFTGTIAIYNCTAPIVLNGLSDTPSAAGSAVDVEYSTDVRLKNSAISGATSSGIMAIGSVVHLDNVSIKNCSTAIVTNGNSIITINGSEDLFEGNTTGLHTWAGGIVLLCRQTPELLGGKANVRQGGAIFRLNGTLL